MSRGRFDRYHVVSDGDLGRCDEAGGVICPLTYVGGADVDAPRSPAPRTSQLPDFAPGPSTVPSARALRKHRGGNGSSGGQCLSRGLYVAYARPRAPRRDAPRHGDAVVEACCMNLVVWESYLAGIAEAGDRDGKASNRSKER